MASKIITKLMSPNPHSPARYMMYIILYSLDNTPETCPEIYASTVKATKASLLKLEKMKALPDISPLPCHLHMQNR